MPSREEVVAALTGPGGPFELESQNVHGVDLRVYKSAPRNLRDVWMSTAALGDRTYLGFQNERVSYNVAHARVRGIAANLHSLGVSKGDRVAIGMRNYPEWVLSFWAAQCLGAIVVSLNAWWTGDEIEYALNDSGAKVLIVDGERFDRVSSVLPSCPNARSVVVARVEAATAPFDVRDGVEWLGRRMLTFEDLCASKDDAPGLFDTDINPDDDSTILYTSGTTGRPKGAVGTHRNHITNITNTFFVGAVSAAMAGASVQATPPSVAKALWTFPFFHIAGVAGITVLTTTGGSIFTQYKWDASEALDLIESEHLTTIAGVPTVVRSLLQHPEFASRDLSSLGGISQGGAPVPPDSIASIERTFKGKVAPGNGYGLTETTSSIVSNSGAAYFTKKDSVGVPMPGADIRIVDESGTDVSPGDIGELWVRSPNNVRGYWNKPEETSRAFTEGWFHTGDAARVDEDGFVYVVDRLKDMVLRGGENVYCAEVEAVLFEHPAVSDVAVFGIPHERLGEEVVAAIVCAPGARSSLDDITEFLSGRLAAFKIPSQVFFRDEPLPRNATGKVLKRDLRASYSPSTA